MNYELFSARVPATQSPNAEDWDCQMQMPHGNALLQQGEIEQFGNSSTCLSKLSHSEIDGDVELSCSFEAEAIVLAPLEDEDEDDPNGFFFDTFPPPPSALPLHERRSSSTSFV